MKTTILNWKIFENYDIELKNICKQLNVYAMLSVVEFDNKSISMECCEFGRIRLVPTQHGWEYHCKFLNVFWGLKRNPKMMLPAITDGRNVPTKIFELLLWWHNDKNGKEASEVSSRRKIQQDSLGKVNRVKEYICIPLSIGKQSKGN